MATESSILSSGDECDESFSKNSTIFEEIEKVRSDLLEYLSTNAKGRIGASIHMEAILNSFQQVVDIVTRQASPPKDEILLNEISSKVDKLLAGQGGGNIEVGVNRQPSYAEIAKTSKEGKKMTRHVVIIESKKEETVEELKNRLKRDIQPHKLQIGVKSLRKARNSVVIEVGEQKDIEILKQQDHKLGDVTIREGKKLLPKLILFNVPKSVDKEEIPTMLFQQNNCITQQVEGIEAFKAQFNVKFSLKKESRDGKNWICEVSPGIRKTLLKIKKLNLEWVRCNIDDFIPIMQCYKCCRFGHIAKECKSERQHCSQCGGDHTFKDCRWKEATPSCVNCVREKLEGKHNACDRKCPVLQRVKMNQILKTDYGL